MRWKRKKKRGERDIEKEKPQVLKKILIGLHRKQLFLTLHGKRQKEREKNEEK